MAYTILNNPNITAGTVTVPTGTSSGTASAYSITNGGYSVLSGNSSNAITAASFKAPSVNIDEDGISMASDTDITIGGQSLKEFMEGVSRRLAILVPDPELLEEFEALKQAYEHYKTLEALCVNGRRKND